MSKDKVFIVATHKHSLKIDKKTGKATDQWETSELIEFVDQLRNKHYHYSTAIGDYINRKMISGSRYGISDYDKFEEYIRTKYKDQMDELDKMYRVQPESLEPLFTDQFGNLRAKTVFDV